MKKNIIFIFCLILCGCITEFKPKNTDETDGILVVEGIITDGESVITLSRSKGLSYEDNLFDLTPYHVTDAKVFIECDDGTRWGVVRQNSGEYTIATGKLNPERQYRLKIEMDETDGNQTKTYEYGSNYDYPIVTPKIDSVFWTKKEKGQPVNIHVATHPADSMTHYYRWTYREDWVTIAVIYKRGLPSICSKNNNSKELLLGTTERAAFGKLTEILSEIPPNNDRFMILYRMDVAQIAISKRAFDYYSNVKKNSTQSGGIFAQIPSEIKGNISCTTDPSRPVIGYMDISSASRNRLYIWRADVYEDSNLQLCMPVAYNYYMMQSGYVYVDGGYVMRQCADCSATGGRSPKELPDDWPYQYENEELDKPWEEK